MYPAIFARTYPLTNAAAVFAAAAADGYRGVQFNLASAGLPSLPEQLPEGLAENIKHQARAAGIALAALSGTYNMAHPDANVRASSRKAFANVVEAARRMGAPVVTLCTGSRDPENMWKHHPENQGALAWSVLRSEVDSVLPLAESAGIKLAIEPEPGNIINHAQAARRLLDEVASPLLGIVLDPANLLSPATLSQQHKVIAQAAQLLGDAVLLAHIKDIDPSGSVTVAGRGAVDFPAFVAALRSITYDGALIAHGFPQDEAPGVSALLTDLIGSPA
ncbi:MAG TPA: sugar phosphate isomerase/epimerase family protein [Acidobacteriaceae bacterium]|nr:sugar phosphate isomerase/epimerase family protein [Acidobacteriaceae bacterium]